MSAGAAPATGGGGFGKAAGVVVIVVIGLIVLSHMHISFDFGAPSNNLPRPVAVFSGLTTPAEAAVAAPAYIPASRAPTAQEMFKRAQHTVKYVCVACAPGMGYVQDPVTCGCSGGNLTWHAGPPPAD